MNWKQLKAYVNEPARTRTQLQRVAAAIGVKSDVKGDSLLGNINRRIESRIKSEEPDAMSGFTLPKARSTNNGSGNRQGERQRQGNQPPPRRHPADQPGDKESTMLNSEVWVELECFDASDLETLRKIAPHYGVRPNDKTFDTLIRDVRFALSKIMSDPAPADVDKILKEWENTPPAQTPPQPPVRREPTPSARRGTIMNDDRTFWLGGLILLLLAALVAFLVYDAVTDDDDAPATTTGSIASDMFGGNAQFWNPISGSDGSGWKYTGPQAEITIPANHRVDYPGASCDEPESRGGVYGPIKIERSGPLSVWNVPGETSCPASASTQPEGSSTSTAQNPATGQNTPATSGNNQTSDNDGSDNSATAECISTTEMNALTHSDVQRVGGKDACAYTLRTAAIGSTGITCPEVLICTLTIGDTHVFVGDDNASYSGVTAGTVRYLPSYAKGDAVYNGCQLTAKEHAFGQEQRPQFPVTPGNFTCENGVVVMNDSDFSAAVDSSEPQCSEDPATDLGGGVWKVEGNKYALQGTATITGHPAWTIHTNAHSSDPGLPPGQSETTNGASAYCDPFKG